MIDWSANKECAALALVLSLILCAGETNAESGTLPTPPFGSEVDTILKIGDLLIDIPRGQHFTAREVEKPSDHAYQGSDQDGATVQVKDISFVQTQAWPMSGTHKNASGWESTDLLVVLSDFKRAGEQDSWCKKIGSAGTKGGKYFDPSIATDKNEDFLVFTEAKSRARVNIRIPRVQSLLLNSPLIYHSNFDYERVADDTRKKVVYYQTYLAISNDVTLQFSFSDNDIKDIGYHKLIENIDNALRSWFSITQNFNMHLYHSFPGSCPN